MNHENSSPELSASKQTHRISVQISISVIKKKNILALKYLGYFNSFNNITSK